MKKIIIILPTLPNYRKDFLNGLSWKLREQNIELKIFHGFTNKKEIKKIEDKEFISEAFETKEISFLGITFTILKGLKQRIIQENPDGIVMLFNPAIITFVRVLFLCLKLRIPYAIWSCGYIRPDLNGIFVKIREYFLNYFDKRATAHIAYHTNRKEYLVKKGINPERIFVAQNTIDTERIMSSYSLEEINKNRFGKELNVLFVGALIKGKFLNEAMTAIDNLISQKYKITFNIIGQGIIFEELKRHRETLKNKEQIHLLGAKYGEDLKTYFLNSDVFLLTGSGGLAINEAMAYGLPIISTIGDGTVKDLIERNGYMIKRFGNISEIQNVLSEFYSLSQEEKLEMSINSIKIIKNKATISLMVDNYNKAINYLFHK
ncbi:MAG: glycosyltransferase family 4 protein [Lachnospiraceae bacterium]|nr:glycosyltransferase family 4 protein [Lachnospiraceae bacterium]